MAEPRRLFRTGEEPIGAAARELLADVGELVRSEIRLARLEVKSAATATSFAALLIGAGLTVGFLGAFFLLLALTFALATAIPFGWAAFVVGLVVAIAGGISILLGIKRLRRIGNDRTLTTTRETLREDAEWLRSKTR